MPSSAFGQPPPPEHVLERLANWLRPSPPPVTLDPAQLGPLNERLTRLDARSRLAWAWQTFGERAAIGTSFQPAGVAILHLAKSSGLPLPAFTLDTGLLFRETIDLKATLQDQLGIVVEATLPELTLEEQARQHGDRLWERDPDKCCNLRKVEPLGRRLRTLDLWITGLRREPSAGRIDVPILSDARRADGSTVWKLNPLADWTREQVWEHLRAHRLPHNALHDKGYRSIGCTVCTKVTPEGGDERAGRWPGFDKTECGLHLKAPRA
jgi:phosphoadenosine phosphosulfate reductase